MQGRHILDGVVTLHETVHEMHRKKLDGVILKIDFEKAYDKVKWSFLQQTLMMKGFSDEWLALINNFVFDGSVAIKVNDDIGRYFQTKKVLRQGDPLSPMLFNIVTDMLAIIIEGKSYKGNILGLDEINARGLIFQSFHKTGGVTKRGHEGPAPYAGVAREGPALPYGVGPSHRLLTYPSAYLKPSSRKPLYREPRYGKPSRDAVAANPISGIQEIASASPERGIITGGLYIIMPASGLMRE
ncbi:hypothetical protein QYE76_058839 [Lolium multiflorum]|uniref:Reverse transcriptase domain-containing protein n=1 Tax=Lolium multiflorum TaxID=4521 RepID=A0AAD8T7V3_LOLMU|nr:hypothetical protein QYE76_058839 [Lolium multiflorum]